MNRPSFEEFCSAVKARLDAGEREYEDKSFQKPPEELVKEITEELLDVCGWSYVLYCRVRTMREELCR